jgi:hypothetical protein
MIEMTIQPTTATLYEVIDRATYRTIGYFTKGDDARAYAALIPNTYVMIYLRPA